MNLTKNLRLCILKQFKSGDTMIYLAGLYEVHPDRIEQVVREALVAQEFNEDMRKAEAKIKEVA